MADLVTLADLKEYLGDAPASSDDALLSQLLSDVQALFTSATLRTPGSYTGAAQRTEVRDGTGSRNLYLAYPIAAGGLISVALGYNAEESLNVANRSVIVYGEGSRCISRVDGGRFGRAGQPRYVTVVYQHEGDLPDDAQLAIKSVCATAYRRRGSEAEKSETLGSFYSHTMVDDITGSDPFWKAAVAANTPVVIA